MEIIITYMVIPAVGVLTLMLCVTAVVLVGQLCMWACITLGNRLLGDDTVQEQAPVTPKFRVVK